MYQESAFAFTLGDECVDYTFNDEQRLEGMCRVCSSSENELTSIFDDAGQSKGIVDLINNHLPILVTPNDLLPVSVCSPCLETLTSIHTLVELCVRADEKMRLMLQDVGLSIAQINNFEAQTSDVSETTPSLEPELDSKRVITKEQAETKLEANNHLESTKICDADIRGTVDKKLYRCLYCNLTDSDAYLLLLHQMKSHPGKLLKCNDCDFIYSADQRDKYNEHLRLHSIATRESLNSSGIEASTEIQQSQGKSTSNECVHSEKVTEITYLKDLPCEKVTSKRTDKVCSKETAHRKHTTRESSSGRRNSHPVGKKVGKTDVHWRCGFCGMKAKSRTGLVDHCNQRHKERVGLSFSSSETLVCSRCKQSFQSELWLKDHLCHSIFLPKTMPSTKPLCCLSCPKVFTEVKLFREHLMSHTNSVKCHVCGAHFRSELNLQTHMNKHENKPSFQCTHCPKTFRLRSRMKIHMRTHTGERPYMCVKCGKRFSTDCGFRLHMAAHEGKKPYVCSLCGQTFNRPSNLRRHEGICGESKVQCRICKEKLSSREELYCHRAMHSKEERDSQQALLTNVNTSRDERFSCKVCDMKFDRVVELSQHRQESHTAAEIEAAKKAGHVDGGAYICPECGKEVYSKKNYERHMLVHSGNTQFRCEECSNIYSTKFALEYHMFTHTGERPFKCDICPEGFKTRISLKIHRMKHTGEKPYKCRLCSMGFITAASLRLHLVTHSDTRMFSCNFCSATFKRKKTLVTHVRIHTGEKPYACKFCGRRFTQKGSCSQHEKSHTESKVLRGVDGVLSDMHVTVIKNWRDEVIEPFPQDEASRIDILVSQDDSNASQCEEVQHMVLIQQDVDCVIGEPDLMEISEDIVLQNKHTIVIEQDGMLADTPMSGLKDANSDPQMPVLDE